jgi:GAF domain-containing protein
LVQAADAEWIVQYVVSVRGGGSASVDAPNWLAALGIGLDQFGDVGAIDRLACEVLVNGTVLARDARTGLGYVVRPIGPVPTREPRAPGASQLQRDDATEVDGSLLERLVPTEGASDEDSELLEFALPDEPGFTEEQPLPAQEDSAAVREQPTSGWSPVHEVAPVEALDEDEQATVHLDAPVDPVDALADFDEDEDSEVFVEDDITDRFQRRQVPPVVVPGLCSVRDAVAIGPACEAALRSLQAVVPSQAGSVILQDADGKLRFALVSGPNADRLTGSVLPKGAGIAGFCLVRGTSLIVRRAGSDPRFYSEVDRETGFTTHSVLCVPIVCGPDVYGSDVGGPDVCGPDVGGPDVFGCIELLNPPPSRPFLGEDLRAAQDVAEALAVCIRRERSD